MRVCCTCRNLLKLAASSISYLGSSHTVSNRPSDNPLPQPILDSRRNHSWQQRLPERLGTSALWLGSLSLLGPIKLSAVLLAGTLITPAALVLERSRRQQQLVQSVRSTRCQVAGLPRSVAAAHVGLSESQLFRARHASVCTVHHDNEGRIVALEVPRPRHDLAPSSTDAHPVG